MSFLSRIFSFFKKEEDLSLLKINRYGWIHQHPDHRDFKYGALKLTAEVPATLPALVDLRDKLPACWDQGQIGSCTGHGIAGALVFDEQFEKETFVMPSRLFIYYNERDMEGSISSDAGGQIRDGVKAIANLGFSDEKLWPYVENQFATKPPQAAYANGVTHKALNYFSLDNTKLDELKGCLAAGFPFIFGFTVYDSFEGPEVAKTGILNLPQATEQQQGGHCVLCVGYDDASKRFIVRNSWGTDWGQNGYFTIPYDYLTNPDLADDFWTIRKIM